MLLPLIEMFSAGKAVRYARIEIVDKAVSSGADNHHQVKHDIGQAQGRKVGRCRAGAAIYSHT